MREGDADFEALRAAIEQFAIERAPELVAEARAEALTRVRSMLSDAMAQSLLDQAREQLASPGDPPPSPPVPTAPTTATRREPPSGELGYYVYGVARAGEADVPDDLAGIDPGRPVTVLEHEGLVALTSRVSLAEFGEEELRENLNDVEWLEEKARSHERVLDEALARMTVVPLRLCTIYRGEAQVRQMLSREHEVFADALDYLVDKAEWSVKLVAEPGALTRAADAGRGRNDDDDAGTTRGTAYMRDRGREARTREEVDRVAEDWAGGVHDRLASRAAEALVNPLQNPEVSGHAGDMLLNGVYLVEDVEIDSFRAEVDDLAEEYRERGASVELSGPWPPYNFVRGSIEAAR